MSRPGQQQQEEIRSLSFPEAGGEGAEAFVGKRDVSSGSVHLDALRGGAALLVFLGHTRALYFSSVVSTEDPETREANEYTQGPSSGPSKTETHASVGTPDLGSEIKLASEAVIIFFVLSGYLVGGSVLRLMRTARWSWKTYLTKRLTRLYVVLIPALVIGCGLDYFGSKIFSSGSVYQTPSGIDLVTTYGLVERFKPTIFLGNLLFLDNFRVPYIGTNVALWSLSNEFWYYLIFPMLCLALLMGRNLLWRIVWLIAALGLMAFTGRDVSLLFPIWILGALVSVIPRRFRADSAKWISAAMGLLLLAAMLGVRLLHWPALQADYLIALVTAGLLYVLAQQTGKAKPGLYKALASFFSRISYTLYLFHVPLAVFACALLNNPWQPWPKTPMRLCIFVLTDSVLVTLAYLLWKLFESRTDAVRNALFRMEEKPSGTIQ